MDLREGDRGVIFEFDTCRGARAVNTHTRAVGIFLFSGSRGGLELYYDIDTKQFTWNTARQSKAPEVPKKAAKSFKNTLGMAGKYGGW